MHDNYTTLLEEIKTNRTELKHFIEASETRVLLKIEELHSRIKELEKENKQLKQKLEVVERNQKKKQYLNIRLRLGRKLQHK